MNTENQWGRNLQNLSYSFDDVGNIEERTDASGRYSSTQSYSYDGLYQLETASGTYVNKPSGHTSWTDRYSQSFSYDGLGNILKKTSTETRVPSASVRPLNYELDYEYDEHRPHLATRIGEFYYSYDANGNVTRESTLPDGQSSAHEAPNLSSIGEVRRADQAFGFINEVESGCENEYIRSFSWDAENRLKSVLTSNGKSVKYLYDADGNRTTKYAGDGSYTEGISGETLYFNEWWTETADSGSFRRAKHIYVGTERIVTRLSNPSTGGNPYEDVNTYYYHPDHLGSAHCITDPQGNPYERIEYTPYGEMWIEIQEDEATASYNYIPFRFTAKEWDEETGLYYYGARYMDPKTSRWMSGDPAGSQLMNPMDGEGKPRQGYSIVEATNWYSYVSNNPVKYVDPNGNISIKSIFNIGQLMVSNPQPLGTPMEAPRSAYGKQFTTIQDSRNATAKVFNAIGFLPSGVTQVLSWLAVAAGAAEGEVDPSVVGYHVRKAFMAGAADEMKIIDTIIGGLDPTTDQDFIKFLSDEKGLLLREINVNSEYDAEEVEKIKKDFGMYAAEGMGGRGGEVPRYEDKRPTSITTDSIDYQKEFNESR